MKIKDFFKLCKNGYIHIDVYDISNQKTERFMYKKEAISKYGFFPVIEWYIEKNDDYRFILCITTKTEF